jgi:hypothetical protein
VTVAPIRHASRPAAAQNITDALGIVIDVKAEAGSGASTG